MPVVNTDWWCMQIPDEWFAEYEEDVVTIMDCDEIGVLDISTLLKEGGEVNKEDIAELYEDLLEQKLIPQETEVAGCGAKYFEYEEDGLAWREWYINANNKILFVTYHTEEDNKGMDDSVVDEILETIVFL